MEGLNQSSGAKGTSLRHPLTRSLLVLTATTGLVDAASYLGLGHVFAANMTGNIVLLGFGIVGGYGLPVVAPLVSLGAFLIGAAAGGRLVRSRGEHRGAQLTMALTVEAGVLAAAAVVAGLTSARVGTFASCCVIALLALGMGVRNATVRKLAVPDLTTTVLTMTLTGLAADSSVAGGSGAGSVRRTSAVVAMLVGALAGALLLKVSLWLVIVVAGASTAVTFLGYRRTVDGA
jgi:uncharacterized membrane protein YoaK (UPF0700 family)